MKTTLSIEEINCYILNCLLNIIKSKMHYSFKTYYGCNKLYAGEMTKATILTIGMHKVKAMTGELCYLGKP